MSVNLRARSVLGNRVLKDRSGDTYPALWLRGVVMLHAIHLSTHVTCCRVAEKPRCSPTCVRAQVAGHNGMAGTSEVVALSRLVSIIVLYRPP